MVTRLILVRHAKTQSRKDDLPDEERQLTAAGRCSIEARFPVTLELLSDVDIEDVKIWSSPAVRALQTAEVIARTLDIGGIEVKETLYDDDPDAFMAELSGETGTVIAVGHNPFMEKLYQRFAGVTQDMGTGAMASFAFKMPGGTALRGSTWLEWFVQAPRVSFWRSIVVMEEALDKAAGRIERRAKELLEKPEDPEVLHQYRISLRVARSLLAFLQPYCKGAANKRTIRELKELQDPTSLLRELDMLVKELDQQAPHAASVGEACAQERAAFNTAFTQRKYQREIARVASRVRNVPWKRSTMQCGLDPDALCERVRNMRSDCEEQLESVNYSDQEAVHDVRKEAKALRYVTREFEDTLPGYAGTASAHAKSVQDKLGELCDCWNNAQLLVQLCGPEAVNVASRFIVRADSIIADLKRQRKDATPQNEAATSEQHDEEQADDRPDSITQQERRHGLGAQGRSMQF